MANITASELQTLDLGYLSGNNIMQFCPTQLLLQQYAIGIDFNQSVNYAKSEVISKLSNQYYFVNEFKNVFPQLGSPETREAKTVEIVSILTVKFILGSIAGLTDSVRYWIEHNDKTIDNIQKRRQKLNLPIAISAELANSALIHSSFRTETDYPGWINTAEFL